MLEISLQVGYADFQLQIDHLEIPTQGVTALFGRSGCGKSTLLRCLAGLEDKVTGRICFDGRTWLSEQVSLPTAARNVGYVFQQGALFPHLTVRENLAFARDRAPQDLGLERIAEACQIAHRLEARIATLSGGEKQRVAIARTLLSAPDLLLLDEPLSALDSQTKAEILPFLQTLKTQLNLPIILVSHAPDEVLRLADRVVLMEAGRVTAHLTRDQAFALENSPLLLDPMVRFWWQSQNNPTPEGVKQ
jgi:molybdate transport system ATP-binding protein